VAAVARFHCGALPKPRQKMLQELAPADKSLAIQLAGMLRFANAFDGARDGQVQTLQVGQKDGALVVSAAGYSPWTSEAEDISAARHLLELVLRKPILVRPLKATPSRVAQPRTWAPSQRP